MVMTDLLSVKVAVRSGDEKSVGNKRINAHPTQKRVLIKANKRDYKVEIMEEK